MGAEEIVQFRMGSEDGPRPALLKFMERVYALSPNPSRLSSTSKPLALVAATIRLHEKHPGVANRWLAELDAAAPDSDAKLLDADIAGWVETL